MFFSNFNILLLPFLLKKTTLNISKISKRFLILFSSFIFLQSLQNYAFGSVSFSTDFRSASGAERSNFSAVLVDTSITSLDPTLSCGVGTQVRLQAGIASSYQWVRNGVAIPGATTRVFAASISGAYRVRVSDGSGNIDSSRVIDVFIVPFPASGFTVNQSTQCITGNSFTFTNTSTISQGTATYTWYYGDGSLQLSTNGSHTYASPGSYTVKLVATSNYGCVDSTRLNVSVQQPPVADFAVNTSAQCLNGNQFFFTNNSSSPGSPATYRWDFGDGSTSTQVNPAYQFNQSGNFSVKLVATAQSGCRDSVTQNVVVHPKPVVAFTVNNNQQCQTGNFFQFTNNSVVSGGSLTHIWKFGDGVTSGSTSPSHSYLNSGIYPVQLIEVSDKGCKDSLVMNVKVDPSPTALFTVNKTVDCFAEHQFVFNNTSTVSAGTFTNAWDFGDGIGSSTLLNPSYRYLQPGTYRVTLNISTPNNCTSTYTVNLYLNQTPVGSVLPVADTVICEGSFVTLRASAAEFYQWYRNGVAISGATASTYNATEPGIYYVQFRNSSNCASLSTNRVTLTKVFQPTPGFSFDRSCAALSTTFTNTSVVANSLPVQYSWNFGDGGVSTAFSPSHIYQTLGTYTVKLTVTPSQCPQLASFVQRQIIVQTSPESIRYPAVNAVVGRDLQLQARQFSGASYQWSPGTALSSRSIANPVFNHSSAQEYLISITTAAGCEITDTLLVRIFAEKKIYVPDYFTPNNDGKNDQLMPLLVGLTKLSSFRIWNRWGQLVYQTNKQGEGWNGIYQGVKQPMETYTWIAEGLDIDGKIIRANGSSVLVR